MYQRGYLREHSNTLLWVMRLLDVLVSLLFCFIGYYLVFGKQPPPPHYQVAVVLSAILLLLVFHAYSLYRTWRGIDYIQEMAAVMLAWTTVFGIQVFLTVITKTSEDYSRSWLVFWYSSGAIALLSMRYLLRRTLSYMRSRGFNLRHIVIISSGDIGKRVLTNIMVSPESGFNVAAHFSDDNEDEALYGKIRYGAFSEAKEYLDKNDIDQVWIAMPFREADRIESVMEYLKTATVDIRLVPDFLGFRLINHSISAIAGMPVINLSVTPMDGVNYWIKAIEDKVVSILILICASPALFFIASAVKLTSPGPVFYKQSRLSWNGKKFTMYKFRTMPMDVEEITGPVWAISGEKRATSVGKILRRTSLDELPQFWNVLKGDMSIVGPRPERPIFVEQLKEKIPSYMQKHMVKGGITGWAQINGWRGDTDITKRIEYDLYYIDNWSLWFDLKIIFISIFKGFIHKNAY
jgi:putative colanic acid biosynthesis UDP-glucose lipid carrier transferase